MVGAQHAPRFSVGEDGKINVPPEGSNWVVSASLRYGRSNGSKHFQYETEHKTQQTVFGRLATETGRPLFRFGDGQTESDKSHLILDLRRARMLVSACSARMERPHYTAPE